MLSSCAEFALGHYMIQSDFPIPRLNPLDENFKNLIDREDLTSREISEIRLNW